MVLTSLPKSKVYLKWAVRYTKPRTLIHYRVPTYKNAPAVLGTPTLLQDAGPSLSIKSGRFRNTDQFRDPTP